jgi:hypothetical protein
MHEDVGYDFVGQCQDGVLVGIEPLLHEHFFFPQCGKGSFEMGDLGLEICDARAICLKVGEHRGLRDRIGC